MKTEPHKSRKASDIYKAQNTLIHQAMLRAGMPYQDHKAAWLRLMTEIAGREVTGLSEMTLWERSRLLNDFQNKGQRIFAQAVPAGARNWKKGDADMEVDWRDSDDPQLRMVLAMWAEMGYPVKTLRGLCWKLFHRDDPRWLNNEQLSHLVNVVQAKAQRKGVGKYYRKRSAVSGQRSAISQRNQPS